MTDKENNIIPVAKARNMIQDNSNKSLPVIDKNSHSSIYDSIIYYIDTKDYVEAVFLVKELISLMKNPWINDRRPIISFDKHYEVVQPVDSPAGPLWIWTKTLNQKIRELPEIESQ
jgi:hypothetical protein